MSTDERYNGWANYETWNVALWCDNEEGIYRERVRRGRMDVDEVERFVRDIFPTGTPDIQNMDEREGRAPGESYAYVNWDEIAEAWNSEHEDEA